MDGFTSRLEAKRVQRVRLMEMTREAIKEVAPRATAIIPVAAIEQHGPHLPIGVDTYITEHVAVEAAQRATSAERPVFVAPILPYGSSHHHRPFAGVLSLSSRTLIQTLEEIGISLILSGFTRIFVLNGHGGNNDAIGIVAQDLSNEYDVVVGAASYWTLAGKGVHEVAKEKGIPWVPGHAGGFETAVIRALQEELIDEAVVPTEATITGPRSGVLARARLHSHQSIANIDGYTDVPALGDAETGRKFLDIIVEEVATVFKEFASADIRTP